MSSTESVIPSFNEEDTMLDIDQEDLESLKKRGKRILYQEGAIIKLTEFIQQKDATMNKQGFIRKYQYKRKRIDTVCYYFLCSPPLSSCSTMAYYHITSDDEVCLFISDDKHEHKDKTERGIPTEIKSRSSATSK